MKKILLFAALLTIGLFFTACKDDDAQPIDDFAPVVNVSSPLNATSFFAGDTIALDISVTEDVLLKSMNVSSDLGIDEDITTFDSETSHDQIFNIVIDPTTPTGLYSITITATDDSNNKGVRRFDITII